MEERDLCGGRHLMKKALVISAGIVHPSIRARIYFRRLLEGVPGLKCSLASSIEACRSLRAGGFAVVAIYLHRQEISPEALASLDGFVSGGGGLFAFHSASASFKEHEGFFRILGGRFVTHGPVAEYTIKQAGGDSLFAPTEPFVLRDKLYIHECDSENEIHFHTERSNGAEPVVWTRPYGMGRVCYVAPGHRAASLLDPQLQAIITRGLAWVSRSDEHE
jgi:type 1 glutamine amidotransferase